jgi:hypothetical protein
VTFGFTLQQANNRAVAIPEIRALFLASRCGKCVLCCWQRQTENDSHWPEELSRFFHSYYPIVHVVAHNIRIEKIPVANFYPDSQRPRWAIRDEMFMKFQRAMLGLGVIWPLLVHICKSQRDSIHQPRVGAQRLPWETVPQIHQL